MERINIKEPTFIAVFRSRDLSVKFVNSHKEVIPIGYVNNLEEFENFVKMEHPNSAKIEMSPNRGSGSCYYTDGNYNIYSPIIFIYKIRVTHLDVETSKT